MHIPFKSPFRDKDRDAIWEMLVVRDIDAFLAQDWGMVAGDFVSAGFFGIDAQGSADPDQWVLRFDTVESYRDEWLRQARETAATAVSESAHAALHGATKLETIDIKGEFAVAQKKFHGFMPLKDGGSAYLNWRTQYLCRREGGHWKIAGFVGYMAHRDAGTAPFRPAALAQHKTAGPYTPVVETRPGARLFVISGQVAVDPDGKVIGDTFEEQSRATLENCRTQLEAAGISLKNVFKVTVYLADLANWARFNAVYRECMPEPYPARTAIQAGLLPGYQVEIEMWATKP